MANTSIYDQDLDQNPANYTPLSPLSYLKRAATLFPEHPAVIRGELELSWAQVYERSIRIADALTRRGVKRGETVAAMLSNCPEMYEAHFAVPMAGAVLNAINTRLDARTVAFILEHAEARVFLVDPEFGEVAAAALEQVENKPLVVYTEDPTFDGGRQVGELSYEALLAEGSPEFDWQMPPNEWDAISLNYTSGTTGNPKGVVYHHRGAYLNAANNALVWNMEAHPRYLWTLPMFHCNGWCLPWTLAAKVGTSYCLRHVREEAIFSAFKEHRITHFCGAPVVLNTLANADDELKEGLDHRIKAFTGGAAPPATVLAAMERINVEVTHIYGLTETYGPMVVSAWQPKWNDLPFEEKTRLKARQGIPMELAEDLMVADPETMEPVPWDGETQGEIMMRGNIVMKGYLKNPKTTAEAFAGGWFHSGDLAVRHPDGYIQIKDRSKDIIISGGENISSIEVESVLFSHPAVLEAAVVARDDEKWGEVPCAFVSLKPGKEASAEEIIAYCRENMAHFKCPKHVVFGPLEKTSTGKVQKYLLREKARSV